MQIRPDVYEVHQIGTRGVSLLPEYTSEQVESGHTLLTEVIIPFDRIQTVEFALDRKATIMCDQIRIYQIVNVDPRVRGLIRDRLLNRVKP